MKKLLNNYLLLAFFFLLSNAGLAQQGYTPNLSTPYQTIKTHLDNLQGNNYHPDLAAKSFMQNGVTKEEAKKYAIKLKQILDGAGVYIQPDELPQNNNYVDSVTNKVHYYLARKDFPRIYLEKQNGKWFYSKTTIEAIDDLHNKIYPLGSDIFLKIIPKFGNKVIWGLYLWQHIAILIIIILGFTVYRVLNYIFAKLISQTLARMGYKDIAKNFIMPIAKPFSILLVFSMVSFMVPMVQLPPNISQYLILGLKAIWPIFAIAIFYHLVDIVGIYLEQLAEKTESTLDDQLVPLVRKSLKTFVVVVGGLFILQNLDVNITALLAGLSIGGLAFALAAQDTIKNFFGSLMIFVDKPFQVGDWVTSGDIDGTVEEVGFRSTRVRTFRNSVTYVPNGKIADSVIDNHGLRQYRRFYTQLAVTYDTPPDLIEVFVEGLNKIVENHPQTRKDYFNIFMNDMGAHSLNIMFYIFFAVPSWPEELRCRHEIILSIIKLADRLGVRFAFPTQTMHMETFPGQQSLTPQYTQDTQATREEMEQYLKSAGKKQKG